MPCGSPEKKFWELEWNNCGFTSRGLSIRNIISMSPISKHLRIFEPRLLKTDLYILQRQDWHWKILRHGLGICSRSSSSGLANGCTATNGRLCSASAAGDMQKN